jgi:hypothetical protein
MSIAIPDGAKLWIQNTLGAAVAVSVAANANPAQLTVPNNHGIADGNEFIFISGWEDATESVYRAIASGATSVSAEGLDTSDPSWFTNGGGTGTAQEITGWTEIAQVTDIQMSGGDPKYATVGLLSRRRDIQVPAGFNAMSVSITLADDPLLAGQQALKIAGRTGAKRAFKLQMPGSGPAYWYGAVSFNDAPQIRKGQANTVQATVSLQGNFTRYAT